MSNFGSSAKAATALTTLAAAGAMFASVAYAQSAPSTDDFVKKAAAGGAAEVAAGKIAEEKGQSKAVKAFGARMVRDHTKAGNELKAAVAKAKLTAPPDGLDSDGQQMIDKLNSASGADFDKTYVGMMTEDHDKDVQEFSAYAKDGDNKQIKGFAKKTLPVIKSHDAQAHRIETQMKKTASKTAG